MSASQPPMPETAEEITRASKSNLALAFIALPADRRADMSVFYAFCRIIDDIADEPGFTREERATQLQTWREALYGDLGANDPELAPAMRALIAKYQLSPEPLEEVIRGCEMDVAETHYETWEDLRLYCYRVASAVGLVSIVIFGCKSAESREYAIQLGLALQVTNILRDVGEDLEIGRIYLPADELAKFGYSLDDLRARRYTPAFVDVAKFQARRACEFFVRARGLLAPEDRQAAVAAEIMRAVYQRILEKMDADGFRVLEKRYRVGSLGKLACIVREIWRSKWNLAPSPAPHLSH